MINGYIQGLARDRRGTAAIEMALFSTFILLPMLGGFVGISQGLELQARLDRGVHAALMDAWNQPALTGSTLGTEMTSAVRNAYGAMAPSVTGTAAWYCLSPIGTRSGAVAVSQSTSCTSPQVLTKWISVTATVGFTPVIDVGTTGWNQAGTTGLVTLNSAATVRVQ